MAGPEGDYRYTRLDTLLHSRIRLAIVAALIGVEEMDFTRLRDVVGATDGNMNTHLKKLEQAKYISVHKAFVERKPFTSYRLTEKGRKSFQAYVRTLEGFIT
jgi:DNA-binding HxlR family transcriptional regulator